MNRDIQEDALLPNAHAYGEDIYDAFLPVDPSMTMADVSYSYSIFHGPTDNDSPFSADFVHQLEEAGDRWAIQDPDNLDDESDNEEACQTDEDADEWMTSLRGLIDQEERPDVLQQKMATSYAPSKDDLHDMLNDLEELDKSDALGLSQSKKGKRRGATKRTTRLTEEAQRLLGDANSAFLERHYDEACTKLQEIIRICPNAHEPYHTLGTIREEQNDKRKAIIFYLVAAHLKRVDNELWKRVGILCQDCHMLEQAKYCMSKSLRISPDDEDLLWSYSLVCMNLKDYNKSMDGFSKLLLKRADDLDLAQDAAKLYVNVDDVPKAIQIFRGVLNAVRDNSDKQKSTTFDHLNIMMELYVMEKRWQEAVDMLEQFAPLISGHPATMTEEKLPLDIRSKLALCHIHLHNMGSFKHIFGVLRAYNTKDVGDLYFDLADACQTENMYDTAADIFQKIVDELPLYDTPSIWARLGECHRALSNREQAIVFYEKVLQLYPDNKDVRLLLADLYDEVGHEVKANQIRSAILLKRTTSTVTLAIPELKVKEVASRVLGENIASANGSNAVLVNSNTGQRLNKFQRMGELWGEKGERLVSAELKEEFRLLARSLVTDFQTCEQFFSTSRRQRPFRMTKGKIKKSVSKKGKLAKSDVTLSDAELDDDAAASESMDDQTAKSNGNDCHLGLSFDQWLQVNLTYANFLVKLANEVLLTLRHPFDVAQTLTLSFANAKQLGKSWLEEAMSTMNMACRANIFFYDKRRMMHLRLNAISIGMQLKDEDPLYEALRWITREFRGIDEISALYGGVLQGRPRVVDQFRQANSQKFYMRQVDQTEFKNAPYLINLGHIFSLTGSISHGLVCYAKAYQLVPNDPLANLFLGISYLHRSMQRTAMNRHDTVMNALACLTRYSELRVDGAQSLNVVFRRQECLYNMGRAYHFLGVNHLAVVYYQRALELVGVVGENVQCSAYTLNYEIAYNLAQIYAESGSKALAHGLMKQYCTV